MKELKGFYLHLKTMDKNTRFDIIKQEKWPILIVMDLLLKNEGDW